MPIGYEDTSEIPFLQEPGSKTGRPSNPGGGGPGRGPGGGFGSFSGLSTPGNGADFRQFTGFNGSLPFALRKRGLPGQIPGVTPGPPGASDTVPAMLTPGEVVMNNGVTQDPQMADALMQLNQQGAQQMQGFSQGGMVQHNFCPHCGSPNPQGYAFGGWVAPPGGFKGGVSSGISQGLGPKLQQKQNVPHPGDPGAPGGAWGGGYTYNPEGGVTNFNPADPWGGMRENRDPRVYGQGIRNLGQAGQAGAFDPRGNQMLINSQIEAAQGTKDALVRRGMSAADLSGLDPAQAAAAKLQTLRDTGRGVQDISAQVRGNAAQSQNDFYQGLYRQLLGGDLGFTGADQQARLQDYLANQANQRQKKGQWGQLGGSIVGAGVGGYFGGQGQHAAVPQGGGMTYNNNPADPGFYGPRP